eukprot:Cvel_22392.t1-p1 / transcript=Cvel_22392.t1 / gene=Cvel_22392 / organism=Chromera_velia_CCMP2878 / gene_product=hypothetical protein / transcript_product=hypothetical protein / location=Cvel_scaffold2196:640-1756(-) / protein_length=263 / sequence_SO=supercontig / SO=protein_coding / is_pseudo=false
MSSQPVVCGRSSSCAGPEQESLQESALYALLNRAAPTSEGVSELVSSREGFGMAWLILAIIKQGEGLVGPPNALGFRILSLDVSGCSLSPRKIFFLLLGGLPRSVEEKLTLGSSKNRLAHAYYGNSVAEIQVVCGNCERQLLTYGAYRDGQQPWSGEGGRHDYQPVRSSAAASGSGWDNLLGWVRDLVEEGIEPNPGPGQNKVEFLKGYKEVYPDATKQDMEEAWKEEAQRQEAQRQEAEAQRQFELEKLRIQSENAASANGP